VGGGVGIDAVPGHHNPDGGVDGVPVSELLPQPQRLRLPRLARRVVREAAVEVLGQHRHHVRVRCAQTTLAGAVQVERSDRDFPGVQRLGQERPDAGCLRDRCEMRPSVADLAPDHRDLAVLPQRGQARPVPLVVLSLVDHQDPVVGVRGGERASVEPRGDPGPVRVVDQPHRFPGCPGHQIQQALLVHDPPAQLGHHLCHLYRMGGQQTAQG